MHHVDDRVGVFAIFNPDAREVDAPFADVQKTQAEVSEGQAKVAADQLALARDEARRALAQAELQRREASRALRRQEEVRLDSAAPVVFFIARRSPLMVSTGGVFDILTKRTEFAIDDTVVFQTAATLNFRNESSNIARVDIVDSAQGVLSIASGQEIFLAPGEDVDVSWHRNIARSSLRTDDDLGRPEHWWMTVQFWVRDLGMNTCDSYRFGGDFRHSSIDGSRLIVDPLPVFPWQTNVAEPDAQRSYERLDSESDRSGPRES